MLPASILALPALAPEVPARYVVPGAEGLTVPLTIALIEADVITDPMLRAPRNALLVDVFCEPEKKLSESALSHWWTKLIRKHSCKFFRWALYVQQLDGAGHGHDKATTAWFCFERIGENIPRFALARGVQQLECLREGFGQTVLAVLRDTMELLPDSFTPWYALMVAECLYWDYTPNDLALLEHKREMHGYATVQELVDSEEVVTRAAFYARLPEWVCDPKRALSREDAEAAASNDFARRAVAICDAISGLVNRPDFILRPDDAGACRCGRDTIAGAVVLLWEEFDVVGQAIDDGLEDIGNGGYYSEFIDANPVPITVEGVRRFMTITEQKLELAVLAEKLILLLGEKL